jgi:hypothetical protein
LQGTCGLCQLGIYERNHSKYTNEVSNVDIVVDDCPTKWAQIKNHTFYQSNIQIIMS